MDYRNLQNSPSLGRLSEAELDGANTAKFTPLHPVIAFALAPLRPPLPLVFRADMGRQKAFLSRSDAMAYDRGYRSFPQSIPMQAEPGTPEAMGYCDASDDAEGVAGMDDAAEWARTHTADCGVHS